MGRKKQTPRRAGGIFENSGAFSSSNSGENVENPVINSAPKVELVEDVSCYVDVDQSSWGSVVHRDISEVVLTNLNLIADYVGYDLNDDIYLRFKLCNVNEHVNRIKLGHWPVISSDDIYLEFIQKKTGEKIGSCDDVDNVIVCGQFDGSDEGVTGLVHLVSLKFLTLRPVSGVRFCEGVASVRIRVEVLECAFDACESLLDNSRQVWKRSMMSVMAWVRPEVTTSEVRYGVELSDDMEVDLIGEGDTGGSGSSKFDVGSFYEALRRSKECPMLDVELPDLIPELRPYQRRAAYWMVQREKGTMAALEESISFSPLCVAVNFLDSSSRMFYNPFSGSVSLCQDIHTSYVFGGILADEMGLGKTVELLACIFAHRRSSSEGTSSSGRMSDTCPMEKMSIKRVKRERIECICGALSESYKYKGLWVQCDICDAWQHADCVGYFPRSRKRLKGTSKGKHCDIQKRKKNEPDIVMMDDEHICKLCSELMQATGSPVESGATLIVCPAPILPQWHAEILRHTKPGSLKTCVYEGVRDISLGNAPAIDICELASADIVLTTYDVLKDDLSHDSERHEGDRRLMRYEKRYPVVPTLMTRVFWWRVCLDEAQMVESNVAPATEMALRLHARHRWCITGTPIQRKLDDLYYLLRFLKANPFDLFRWWTEIIREPYERRDAAAIVFTHQLFKQLMWRSSKSHVVDELLLPAQEEHVSWLSFSPVEEHFYQRQHEACADVAHEVLRRFRNDMLNRKGSGSELSNPVSDPFITHLEAAKLLNSLLKLRQACCHPQVGGSGLCSLQRSPLTMDEVLSVLISKTKVEGEEALRKVVSSLNGLAGIAMLQGELTDAASLYKEALSLGEEHYEDFRVDPLLKLHIHHNLAEICESASYDSLEFLLGELSEIPEEKPFHTSGNDQCGDHINKYQRATLEVSGDTEKALELNCKRSGDGTKVGEECDIKPHAQLSTVRNLISVCESIKKKYLSGFYAKLLLAQQEFYKQYAQVCDSLHDEENKIGGWWLDALRPIQKNKEAETELLRKIENAVLPNKAVKKEPRITSCFRTTSALIYFIQSRLDSLEASRKCLLDQLQEIDQRMERPRDEDFERIRHCSGCYFSMNGPLCVHCELNELFKAYEARLFLKQNNAGEALESAEQVVDLQNKKLERYHILSNLEQKSIEIKGKRDVGQFLVVSRSPSELEIIFGVIRNYFKKQLGREGVSAANRHLVLLEGMRKEYAHARSLASAQAQVLCAYDEIKMATSRFRLKENDDDNSIDALGMEELDIRSVQNSSEKFVSLAALSRIRGKLRYLQGLAASKQKTESDSKAACHLGSLAENGDSQKAVDICPVCQEILKIQRMVFQCGHVTCCKCFVVITERRVALNGNLQDNMVTCPTCRQHSDFKSIALVDDRPNVSLVEGSEDLEASVPVQGSYGTKIEAITRRIHWIKSKDPKAKVLVFSSWNDVLDLLQHAFEANDITYVRMKGGRKKSQAAISIFKGEKGTGKNPGSTNAHEKAEGNFIQVLLLLVQHGANGLNLLEGKHVILVEPLINPAAEAQAISRVHRVGQTKETLVHRFIVKSTVEESLYKLNKSRNTNSFISGNKKNQDQPVLTVKDVESLFSAVPPTAVDEVEAQPGSSADIEAQAGNSTNNEAQTGSSTDNEALTGSLTHLPPSVAAAVAAERRLAESRT